MELLFFPPAPQLPVCYAFLRFSPCLPFGAMHTFRGGPFPANYVVPHALRISLSLSPSDRKRFRLLYDGKQHPIYSFFPPFTLLCALSLSSLFVSPQYLSHLISLAPPPHATKGAPFSLNCKSCHLFGSREYPMLKICLALVF